MQKIYAFCNKDEYSKLWGALCIAVTYTVHSLLKVWPGPLFLLHSWCALRLASLLKRSCRTAATTRKGVSYFLFVLPSFHQQYPPLVYIHLCEVSWCLALWFLTETLPCSIIKMIYSVTVLWLRSGYVSLQIKNRNPDQQHSRNSHKKSSVILSLTGSIRPFSLAYHFFPRLSQSRRTFWITGQPSSRNIGKATLFLAHNSCTRQFKVLYS